ncbi:helix-hairpin-helix domain-containing protein [Natronorarus salvus]|uniref:helix-hairpin-helix domain-containing protein n=1 Tax=Natronorarus salvus TaxID=3117733 RepID=UPI002F26609E
MALLKKVKSLLGLADEEETGTSDDEGDVGVTVEREPEAEPAPEPGPPTEEPTGEPPGTGIAEEPPATEEPPIDGEPTETEPVDEPAPDTDEPVERTETAEPVEETVVEAEPGEFGSEPSDDPVVEIKGIGPSYADRLGEAGVETVSDLADADAEELGEATGISPKRIEAWIDRARVR